MAKTNLIVRRAMLDGREVDVLVHRGKIVEVRDCAPEIDPEEFGQVEDAYGLSLMPSMTDVHVHLREPGFEYKEDIASGLGAAAWGGFGNILCMANTSPVNDTASVTETMLEKAGQHWPNGPRLFPIGALTKGLKGEELSPMAELKDAGCVAVSNDGVPVKNTDLFRKAMDYAANFGLTVIDHCEDPYMAVGVGVNDGEISDTLGLPGQPDVAEALQVARDVLLAEFLDVPVHLAHVSCEKSVDIIRRAKRAESASRPRPARTISCSPRTGLPRPRPNTAPWAKSIRRFAPRRTARSCWTPSTTAPSTSSPPTMHPTACTRRKWRWTWPPAASPGWIQPLP